MHLEGASDMKNNDNLKEKEIKQEKTMDKNELESVSGGEAGFHYYVRGKMCVSSKCREPHCAQNCPYGAVKYDLYGEHGEQCIAWIETTPCIGCRPCGAQSACPTKGAIDFYFW
jgi:bacteriocin-like protein